VAVERVRFVRNITLYAAFLLVLATLCVGVFWFVLHSREVALLQGPPGYVNMRGTYVPNVTNRPARKAVQPATLKATHGA
jgi:hypothetical protein